MKSVEALIIKSLKEILEEWNSFKETFYSNTLEAKDSRIGFFWNKFCKKKSAGHPSRRFLDEYLGILWDFSKGMSGGVPESIPEKSYGEVT